MKDKLYVSPFCLEDDEESEDSLPLAKSVSVLPDFPIELGSQPASVEEDSWFKTFLWWWIILIILLLILILIYSISKN